MEFIKLEKKDGIATLTLVRGKVNALNGAVIDELRQSFKALEGDAGVKAVILTGTDKFFSFGFDLPEFVNFTPPQFTDYLSNFTDFYTTLFLYPKPVVAALNGHTIAGGCMLALACDYRVMVSGKAKIALNEIGFGAAVFAGATEMLRFCVGSAHATAVLYSGAMYSAEQAKNMGLVEEVTTEAELMGAARKAASDLGSKYPPAFAGIKSLLRKNIAEEMKTRESVSIRKFVEIWYSPETWARLQDIKIR